MIERAAGGAVSLALAAATAANPQPVVANFFGYQFEVAGMIAALLGCLVARFWLGTAQQTKRAFRLQLDLPVSAMTLATAAGVIMTTHLAPLYALLVGTGIGIVGEGLFKVAESYADKFGLSPTTTSTDPTERKLP